MDYLSALNEKQLEAVTATEGYLRVIAGAGSGKTIIDLSTSDPDASSALGEKLIENGVFIHEDDLK